MLTLSVPTLIVKLLIKNPRNKMIQPSITSFFSRKSDTTKKDGETKANSKIKSEKRQRSGSGSENENSPKNSLAESANKKAVKKMKTALSSPEAAEKKEPVRKTSARKRRILSDSSEDGVDVKVEKTNGSEAQAKTVDEANKVEAQTVDEAKTIDEAQKVDEAQTKSKTPKKETPNDAKKVVNLVFGKSPTKTGNKTVTEYNPSRSNYHPINDAIWKKGEKVPYLALTKTLADIENISARLKIVEILSNFFRSVLVLTPEDLLPSVYLCLNKLAPAYEGIELGVAETSLMKAIAQSTGRSLSQIKADSQNVGDLGIVAEQSKTNQRMIFQPAPLTVRGVFEKLREIAKMSGHASQAKKIDKIQAMFVACKQSEARFLIRSLAGKLRIGLAEQSVLQAIALACTLTPPCQDFPPEITDASKKTSPDGFKAKLDENALVIKTTFCECPNYDLIIPVLLREGVTKLPEHCKLTPGVPLKPMLAHPTKGVQEVLQRFDGLKFTCEWKYDGERAQIHITNEQDVRIFSRNQENNTSKYPDVISRLENCKLSDVKSCILDCEAVAWDKEKKQILPFQILSTRKRKDASEADIKVQVCVFMFDLLYLNGVSLVKKPFLERRNLLKTHFKEVEGEWYFAKYMDTETVEQVQEFLEESVKGNCEGLMVKTLEEDATYEIAKRSRNWLKLKKDYLEGVGDTLDVVVIGGYLGKGKRTGTYGGFLLACYDHDNEEYQSICKIGTGFTDEHLQEHTDFLKKHLIPEPKNYYRYDGSHEPDHWFDAVQVWEIKCADLSLSPAHRAAIGIVDPEKGISLRFPRFVRVREDKSAEQATSAQQIADMYSNQDQIKNLQGQKQAEEDFY